MRRILTALAAATLAAVLLAPAASARLRVTFRYLAVHPIGRVIDRPPADEIRGDVVNFRFTLRTRRGVVGTEFFTFRYTSRSRPSRAAVRLRFREGTVLASGALDTNADVLRFRVTGGTGVFRGSRGVVVEARDAGDNVRLVLRLF